MELGAHNSSVSLWGTSQSDTYSSAGVNNEHDSILPNSYTNKPSSVSKPVGSATDSSLWSAMSGLSVSTSSSALTPTLAGLSFTSIESLSSTSIRSPLQTSPTISHSTQEHFSSLNPSTHTAPNTSLTKDTTQYSTVLESLYRLSLQNSNSSSLNQFKTSELISVANSLPVIPQRTQQTSSKDNDSVISTWNSPSRITRLSYNTSKATISQNTTTLLLQSKISGYAIPISTRLNITRNETVDIDSNTQSNQSRSTSMESRTSSPLLILDTTTSPETSETVASSFRTKNANYYVYTQQYLFTDSTTTFETGLLYTTSFPKLVTTSFQVPQNTITAPVSEYNKYLRGSLDDGNTRAHGANTGPIVGGVVGGIGGLLASALVIWVLFFRRKSHNTKDTFPVGDNSQQQGDIRHEGDPFENEFDFHQRSTPPPVPPARKIIPQSVSENLADLQDLRFSYATTTTDNSAGTSSQESNSILSSIEPYGANIVHENEAFLREII